MCELRQKMLRFSEEDEKSYKLIDLLGHKQSKFVAELIAIFIEENHVDVNDITWNEVSAILTNKKRELRFKESVDSIINADKKIDEGTLTALRLAQEELPKKKFSRKRNVVAERPAKPQKTEINSEPVKTLNFGLLSQLSAF